MKVFISWSGSLSHNVALLFKEWLPAVLQVVEPYVSTQDLEKGSRWFNKISSELDESDFGIVCITKKNAIEPWISFEAGALAKKLERARVTPFLIDLKPSELQGPLVQFQATNCTKEDVYKLVESINNQLSDDKINTPRLLKSFEKWWDDFRIRFDEILETSDDPKSEEQRDVRDIIEELLELSRSNARNISIITSDTIQNHKKRVLNRVMNLNRQIEVEDLFKYMKTKEEAFREFKNAIDNSEGDDEN